MVWFDEPQLDGPRVVTTQFGGPRVVATQLDAKIPGLWIRAPEGSGIHSGFYPMPRNVRAGYLSWHAHYDTIKTTDGILVRDATGGMNAVEGYYKRISSKDQRPYHFQNYFRIRDVDSEARKQRSWKRNCKKGLPKGSEPRDWYLNRKGRIVFFDGRQWVMTQCMKGGVSPTSIYINKSTAQTAPSNGWMFVRPAARGGPDAMLTFKVRLVTENPFNQLENDFASGNL